MPEEADDDEEEEVDESAEGVAKMRASEIKAELDMRGVGYAGIFEKVCGCSGGASCVNAACHKHPLLEC